MTAARRYDGLRLTARGAGRTGLVDCRLAVAMVRADAGPSAVSEVRAAVSFAG